MPKRNAVLALLGFHADERGCKFDGHMPGDQPETYTCACYTLPQCPTLQLLGVVGDAPCNGALVVRVSFWISSVAPAAAKADGA